jgi:hypothetical protein
MCLYVCLIMSTKVSGKEDEYDHNLEEIITQTQYIKD